VQSGAYGIAVFSRKTTLIQNKSTEIYSMRAIKINTGRVLRIMRSGDAFDEPQSRINIMNFRISGERKIIVVKHFKKRTN